MADNKKQEEQNGNGYKEDRNIGFAVFILLIALTIGEFFIGYIATDWNWPLWGFITSCMSRSFSAVLRRKFHDHPGRYTQQQQV